MQKIRIIKLKDVNKPKNSNDTKNRKFNYLIFIRAKI